MGEIKKYELTSEIINVHGVELHRIKALVSFGNVKAGDLGGYIESEKNLSQFGNAWVSGNAKVCDNAKVSGDAKVCGNALVYGNAEVYGNALVYGNAEVYGNALVYGDAWVCGDADVYGNAKVYGNADYTTIKGFGSKFRCSTFFRCKDEEVRVSCGCFYGTIPEFREKVKETHGDSKFAKEYLMIADLMEMHFADTE